MIFNSISPIIKEKLDDEATERAIADETLDGKISSMNSILGTKADQSDLESYVASLNAALDGKLPLTGGTLSGNISIQKQSYPNLTMINQNWGGQFAITEGDDGTALFQNNKTVDGKDTYAAFYLKPASAGLGNVLSIGMDDGSGWKGATVLHSQNFADHITPAGIGAPKLKAPNDLVHNNNEFTFIPAGHSGELYINYRTSSGLLDGNISNYHFCGGNGNEVTIIANYFKGKFQGNGSRPEYNGADVAMFSDVPQITASTTDIGEGSPLATGTLYLVYE